MARGVMDAAQRVAVQLPRARRRSPSKCERSRARSGRLQRRVRRSSRSPAGCRPHAPTTLVWDHALHNGRSVGTTPIWNHARHNALSSEPRAAHDHAAHNGRSAQPASAPHVAQRAISTTSLRTTRCTTSACTPRDPHNGAFNQRDSLHHITNGLPPTLPGRRTVCASAAPHY
jgi:hypothetical protein